MSMIKEKQQILKNNGYTYHFDRMLYFNKADKKIFSLEFIEDHSVSDLENCIKENKKDWKFYCNPPGISENLQKEILKEIDR